MLRWTGPVVALVAALALAVPAGAATGFATDETLTSASTGIFDVAMAPNGFAIAGWIEGASRAQVVRVSVRPPGGSWSAPQSFPVSLDSSSGVSVAIASSGAAAVTWGEVSAPSTDDVGIATRAPGAAFTRAEVLSGVRQVLYPSVGVAADGTVTLLYDVNPDTVVRDFSAGGSALAASQQPLAPNCYPAFFSGIAEAPSGDAVVPLSCGGASFALRAGGSWNVSPPIADDFERCPMASTYHTAVMAAIDTAGHPVGVLETHVSQPDVTCMGGGFDSDSYREQLVLPLAGVMTPVATTVASGSTFGSFGLSPISGPQTAISPSGIVFAWGAGDLSFRSQLHARFFGPDGGSAGADGSVGAQTTGVALPRLALAGNGRGLLSWTQSDGTGLSLFAAQRAPGTNAFGPPGAPLVSGRDVGSPLLAMDDAGDGLVAWTQGPGPVAIHVRGYDATPPALSGVSIPANATAGTRAAFSASPSDLWGPVAVRWAFGDGASATGAAAQHAYARAGRFTVTATATDAVGNAVARSGSVSVRPAGPAIARLRLTHRRFRVGSARTALSAKRRRAAGVPVGTTFKFTLDPAARVRIAFARQASGLRARGGRCVKPSSRLRRAHARRCTRFAPIGQALTRSLRAGANAVPFSGRIGRKALAPGRYRATLTATAAGRAGAPRSVGFVVVR